MYGDERWISPEFSDVIHHGVIAQLVERVLSMHEALGSTPSNSIFLYILSSILTITYPHKK